MRLVSTLVLTTCLCACGRPAPLAHSQESREALARAVLVAIERRDIGSLNNLALSEAEFRDHVWPELPGSRPERNLPVSYVWGDLHQKSNAAVSETLVRHGGRQYRFVALRFLGDATEYRTFRVQREGEVLVRDAENKEQRLRLFGSVIERAGRFKVFSYVTAD